MVAGELALGIGHKSALMWTAFAHEVHQVLKRIAFDVELTVGPALHQTGQFVHVTGADMALVRTRMHRDAVGPGLQT